MTRNPPVETNRPDAYSVCLLLESIEPKQHEVKHTIDWDALYKGIDTTDTIEQRLLEEQ